METRAKGGFERQVLERLDRLEHRVETVGERIDRLEKRLPQKRREIAASTRIRLADATLALGGRCPCCSKVPIVGADGEVLDAEFDHFYSNQLPTEDHCWLICAGCHSMLTTGTLPRTAADVHFKSFQLRRVALSPSSADEQP